MHKYRKLYVIENHEGDVKIGVGGNPEQRKNTIQSQMGCKITRMYETENCYNPYELKKIILKQYEKRNLFGEWFAVDFDKMVSTLKKVFDETAELEDKSPDSHDVDFLARYFHPEDFEDKE